jgi:hypothetical protein
MYLQLGSRTASSRHRRGAAAAYKAAEVEAALRAFLAAAPPEHDKRPHGFYTLDFHIMSSNNDRAAGAARAAVDREMEAVYEAGLAAEADLPPFFLPVECGVKVVLVPVMRMLRATASKRNPAAAAAAVQKSSDRPASGGGGSSSSVCDRCGVAAAKLMRCSRCQQRRFCSKECQVADWKEGHSRTCGK